MTSDFFFEDSKGISEVTSTLKNAMIASAAWAHPCMFVDFFENFWLKSCNSIVWLLIPISTFVLNLTETFVYFQLLLMIIWMFVHVQSSVKKLTPNWLKDSSGSLVENALSSLVVVRNKITKKFLSINVPSSTIYWRVLIATK